MNCFFIFIFYINKISNHGVHALAGKLARLLSWLKEWNEKQFCVAMSTNSFCIKRLADVNKMPLSQRRPRLITNNMTFKIKSRRPCSIKNNIQYSTQKCYSNNFDILNQGKDFQNTKKRRPRFNGEAGMTCRDWRGETSSYFAYFVNQSFLPQKACICKWIVIIWLK